MPFPDGVLVVDKPAGPTSHDIVAVVRRASSSIVHRPSSIVEGRSTIDDRRSTIKVGHTGTLDPLASGVLPLVIGKATRLAQFLSSSEKEYEADIELGLATTTFDRSGAPVERADARPVSAVTRAMIEEALAGFRGRYAQMPPAFSAKKIDGDRAYDLARRNAPVALEPAEVSASVLDILEWSGARLRVRLVCSAGYYVRSLADSLGEALGTGAHLAGLVRTRSGEFVLSQAVGLDVIDREPEGAARAVVPLASLLPELPALTLTARGASLAARGGFIGPALLAAPGAVPRSGRIRLMHPDGRLIAIAEPRAVRGEMLLHPGVVLE